MPQITDDLATTLAGTVKTEIDDGFVYIYAGPVPAGAADPLNMGSLHTHVAKISKDGDGTTGLTWDTAGARSILKPAAHDWEGPIAFSGVDDGQPTLTPTFARWCEDGDDPEAAATTYQRIQFTVSGPGGGGEVVLASATASAGGPDVVVNAAWISF